MGETTARVVSINRSDGGVPKMATPEAFVSVNGVEGDRQRDRRFHGGPDRALCLYSMDLIDALRREGHSIGPGTTGENVTIAGLEWNVMIPGLRLSLGPVEVELTAFASPCRTIIASFADERSTRISEKVHPGWSRVYARVLAEGMLAVGDRVVARREDGGPAAS
jgi:MOSC domain-containing protein YiiM